MKLLAILAVVLLICWLVYMTLGHMFAGNYLLSLTYAVGGALVWNLLWEYLGRNKNPR